MKRSALIVPGIAAAIALVVVLLTGPFNAPVTQAASSLQFEATFAAQTEFAEKFDYGYSGPNPWDWGNGSGEGAITSFHGDHNMNCEAPTTLRNVAFGGNRNQLDYSQLFWSCLPGGDPAKGHIMTGVDTVGYNIAWFSPKPTFTNVTKVCWDVNETVMSRRKWTQVLFVGTDDATRYPTTRLSPEGRAGTYRGSGGFDLGYTSPDFRGGEGGPSTGVMPQGGTLAGMKNMFGSFHWFQNQDNFTTTDGFGPQILNVTDKAARYKHCMENQPNNLIRVTQATPTGTRTMDIPGQIPSHPVRVVFEDDNYNPEKDELYNSDVLTWHWDNIQVFTDGETPPTTTPPTTTPPTTTPPTTTPPTTTPPTTTPPTTTPPTTTPPTTTPPTTTPPTTTPPTTTPPTTTPPTTTPPTTTPPTTTPPTTEPPTTEPPTTEPPTTEPPTTEPPTTEAPGAPVVKILAGPPETTTDPNAVITFEVDDPQAPGRDPLVLGATVTCSLDGGPAEPCTSPVRYQGLALGEHAVEIRAIDAASDVGYARHAWSVVAETGSNPTDPGPSDNPANPTQPPTKPRAFLSFTGAQSIQIAIIGMMMIALGLALGSAGAISRRRAR